MNDFTKDELEILLHLLDCRGLADSYLQIKIQSMIDNYCDHSKLLYYEDISVGECTECHMVMIP